MVQFDTDLVFKHYWLRATYDKGRLLQTVG